MSEIEFYRELDASERETQMSINTAAQFERISAVDAQAGDVYKDSKIESVSRDRKNIVIRFVGGGSHSMSLAQAKLATVDREIVATELPEGYSTKWLKTGLKLSWRYVASDGTQLNGGVILKKDDATDVEAVKQAWQHKSNVEAQIAQHAAADETVVDPSTMIDVVVVGPNLQTRDGKTFHVHNPKCADRKRPTYSRKDHQDSWARVEAFSSAQNLVEEIMGDIMRENDEVFGPGATDFENYLDEFKIYPCVKNLPTREPMTAAQLAEAGAVEPKTAKTAKGAPATLRKIIDVAALTGADALFYACTQCGAAKGVRCSYPNGRLHYQYVHANRSAAVAQFVEPAAKTSAAKTSAAKPAVAAAKMQIAKAGSMPELEAALANALTVAKPAAKTTSAAAAKRMAKSLASK